MSTTIETEIGQSNESGDGGQWGNENNQKKGKHHVLRGQTKYSNSCLYSILKATPRKADAETGKRGDDANDTCCTRTVTAIERYVQATSPTSTRCSLAKNIGHALQASIGKTDGLLVSCHCFSHSHCRPLNLCRAALSSNSCVSNLSVHLYFHCWVTVIAQRMIDTGFSNPTCNKIHPC